MSHSNSALKQTPLDVYWVGFRAGRNIPYTNSSAKTILHFLPSKHKQRYSFTQIFAQITELC